MKVLNSYDDRMNGKEEHMGAVSEWAGSILSFLIVITVIRGILPSKKYEPYLRLFSGLMLILLVLQPVTGGLGLEKLTIPLLIVNFESLDT